jgi:hypothetical protein
MDRLYCYAVLLQPTEEGRKSGERAELIIPPSDWVVAKSEEEVMLIATRKIPENVMQFADRLEVAVRPF